MEQTLNYPKSRWIVMVANLICYIAVGTYIIMLAPIIGLLSEEFGVTPGQMSFYGMGLYTIINALAIIGSGMLFDRFGVKPVLMTSVAILVVIALLMPVFSQTLTGIIIFRVILAVVAGPVAGCLSPLGTAWFPEKERGLYSGVISAGLPIGITMSLAILGFRLGATHGDWRASLETLTIIPVITFIFVVIFLIVTRNVAPPNVAKEEGTDEKSKLVFSGIVKAPAFWLTILGFCIFTLCLNSFTDLSPGYIAIDPPTGLGLGASTASFTSMLTSIGNITGALFAGVLIDKLFKGKVRTMLIICFLIQAICVFLTKFSFVTNVLPLFMVVLFLTGFTVMGSSVAFTAFVMMRFPLAVNGRVFTVSMGAGLLMGAVGVSVSSGMLHATGTYQMSLLFIAIVAAIGLVPAALLEKVKVSKDKLIDKAG
ncbi:MAG: MFS transporter [Clostridiales Family XIII bacterium]|jgi:MFS family permease|nr:MFS transporter [Clostridiales Family XIII bacterium]